MSKINIDDIKQTMHKLDLIYRPYTLIINPTDRERFEQAIKDTEVEDKVVLKEDSGGW